MTALRRRGRADVRRDERGTIRRDLVPGSLHVYPVPGYGAMEIGTDRFCHVENGKDDCGDFGFAMVWEKKEEAWRVTRVLSYGH